MESNRSIIRDNNESGTVIQARTTATLLAPNTHRKYDPCHRQAVAHDANKVATTTLTPDTLSTKCDRTQRYSKHLVGNEMATNTTVTHRNNRLYEHQQPTKMSDVIVGGRKMHPTTSLVNSCSRNANQSHAYNMADGSDSYSTKSSRSSYASTCTATSCSASETSATSEGDPNLPYPGFPSLSLNYLTQTMRPRNWCLLLITNPWFERVSILVIIFNCITLGMYQPCVDDECVTNRCKVLQVSLRNPQRHSKIIANWTNNATEEIVVFRWWGESTQPNSI